MRCLMDCDITNEQLKNQRLVLPRYFNPSEIDLFYYSADFVYMNGF